MGIVTLLTDFGTRDAYVAEMKGVLLSAVPGLQLIDVSHAIPPGDLLAARLILARVWHRFPEGTVHLAVVDPGVGSARRAIALEGHGHRFVGPDNGIFSDVLDGATGVALPVPPQAAPTFHGRDVFAPAAAALAGGTPLAALGAPVADPVRLALPQAECGGGRVRGEVLMVDHFGNLVTNIPADAVPAGAGVSVERRTVGPVRRTFADVARGSLVAYVGSGGTIEVAVRDGSAAQALGAARGARVQAEWPARA